MAKTIKKEPLDKKNNLKLRARVVINKTAQNWQSLFLIFVALLVAFISFSFTDKKIKVPFLS
jgi:hypothetical protein